MRKLRPKRSGTLNRRETGDQLEEQKDDFADFEKERLTSKPNAGGLLNHALTIIIGTIILMVLATNHFKTDVYGLLQMLYQEVDEILGELETSTPHQTIDEKRVQTTAENKENEKIDEDEENNDNKLTKTPRVSQSELIKELEAQNNSDPADESDNVISEAPPVAPPLPISKPNNSVRSSRQAPEGKELAQFTNWYHIFDEEFLGTKWDLTTPITWATVPEGETYQTAYGKTKRIGDAKTNQVKLIRQAFDSWNSAVSKKIFVEEADWTQAQVIVGVPSDWNRVKDEYNQRRNKDRNPIGLWHAEHKQRMRVSGSIEIDRNLTNRLFLHVALHEIGNILGLGDVVFSAFETSQSQQGKRRGGVKTPQPIDVHWLKILYREHFKDVSPASLVNAEVQGAMKKRFRESGIEYPSSCTRFTNQTLEFEVTFEERGAVSDIAVEKSAMCDQYATAIADALLDAPEIALFKSLSRQQFEENQKFRVVFYSGRRTSLVKTPFYQVDDINTEPTRQTNNGTEESVANLLDAMTTRVTRAWRRPVAFQGGLEVFLKMSLRSSGELEDILVIQSSGDELFDQSAVRAVQRAAPFKEVKQFDARTFEERFKTLTVKFRPED